MTTAQTSQPSDLAALAKLEEHLADQLAKIQYELDHTDCFDPEQRAEIYTIVQALREDTQAHLSFLAQAQSAGQFASAREE
ncbi:MAG: hypothetical protein FWE88_00340 [Phycisphaerae bacterium]|nr:hypothetical protein [Phycisphaerae bacterium]